MINQQDRLILLLCKRTLAEPLTPAEESVLSKWFIKNEHRLAFDISEEYIREMVALEKEAEASWERFKEKHHDKLYQAPTPAPSTGKYKFPWKRVLRAAAALMVFLAGKYFYQQYSPGKKTSELAVNKANTIMPGGYKALLTLANGTVISLDSTQRGVLAQQGSSNIVKRAKDGIMYKNEGTAKTKASTSYPNTLTTPRGGQYQVVLADGTTVWLNAASSLHYPSSFTGAERVVELSGEAYFEVAKDNNKPFKVKLKDGTIRVLGTHFNVNAYDDEPAAITTLVEGTVKITTNKDSISLTAGQQASIGKNQLLARAEQPDIDRAIAWTSGYFDYYDVDFKEVLKRLQRWYDFQLFYDTTVKSRPVVLQHQPRAVPITKILDNLKLAVSFKYHIEGKKLILSN